jgi:hypothetical protein
MKNINRINEKYLLFSDTTMVLITILKKHTSEQISIKINFNYINGPQKHESPI